MIVIFLCVLGELCLPNLPCAIHVSDSEVYPVELLRRSTRRDSTGAYFTGVELSFGCYSIGVRDIKGSICGCRKLNSSFAASAVF